MPTNILNDPNSYFHLYLFLTRMIFVCLMQRDVGIQ